MSSRGKRFVRFIVIPLLAAAALLCSGCVRMYDPEASQEQSQDVIAIVKAGQVFGQSFVALRPRLEALALQLAIAPDSASANGTLTIELYHTSGETTPITTREISYAKIAASNPLNISVPVQPDSAGKDYYLVLKTGQGAIQVLGRAEDVYPRGEASLNDQPLAADASLREYYDYDTKALLADLAGMASNAWLLLPLGLLLFLPGYLALDLLGLGKDFEGTERFALALGFSLALIPLLMTWTSLTSLRWSGAALWFAAGLLCALGLWRLRHRLRNLKLKASGSAWALAGVLLVSLVVRIAMARDLSAPPWVDSIHHGVITRLILQGGGFPATYAPFMDLSSAQYHAGFHSLLASFIWLTGLPLPDGMLILGQILNALAVVAVFLLTTSLTGDRIAGVFAALIAGIFTPMPAYYTSWGRYTHLTSLLILPAAFVWVKYLITYPPAPLPWREGGDGRAGTPSAGRTSGDSAEGTSLSPDPAPRTVYSRAPFSGPYPAPLHVRAEPLWKPLLMAAITGGGLFLTHYRAGAFLVCLVLAYLLVRTVMERRWTSLPKDLGLTVLAGLLALVLVLPWLVPTVQNLLLPKLAQWKPKGASPFNSFAWTYLTAGLGKYTLALAGVGLAWGLVAGVLRRQWFVLTLALWCGLMFLASNLDALGLLGSGFINNMSVQITLFMPLAVLGGFLAGELFRLGRGLLREEWQKAFAWATAAACLGLAAWGSRTLLPLLNPTTFLYRQADHGAIQWIAEHVPEGETVVINPFSWGYGLYAGSDGGYWISALAGRQTLPPPVLYGLENNTSEIKQTNNLIQQVIAQSTQPEALADLLRANMLHYVYIGAKGGPLSARLLKESASFEMLYQGDGTWVFKVLEQP